MVKYKKVYCDYFGYKQGAGWIPCEVCGTSAVDVHHITHLSQGGRHEIINLMALCRTHHFQYHAGVGLTKEELQSIHNTFMENYLLMKSI